MKGIQQNIFLQVQKCWSEGSEFLIIGKQVKNLYCLATVIGDASAGYPLSLGMGRKRAARSQKSGDLLVNHVKVVTVYGFLTANHFCL